MPPIWVIELADRFWATAGPPPALPRDLTTPALFGVGVTVTPVPGLTLAVVRDRLARIGLACPAGEPGRPLRACLFARGGAGWVFVDAADPPAERRFSVAHEVAHFLRDVDAVRRAVRTRLGPAGPEVLDGRRPPTADERVQAVLRGVPLGAHVHLLGRDDDGRPRSAAERDAEQAADRLAFELLAPADVLASEGREPPDSVRRHLVSRLECEFGLPPGPAADYARLLAPPQPADAFFDRIRKLW